MLYLGIDTAYKNLGLVLIKDQKIIASYDEFCFKNQSEQIFVKLLELFKQTQFKPLDIDGIIISKGPGSYTGIRIAMTLAKTICQLENKIKLYTISTLKLYANNLTNTLVLLDARANRVFCGVYDSSKTIIPDGIKLIEDLDLKYNLVGDLSLVGKQDLFYPSSECFLNTLDHIEEVENIAHLTPNYLKDNDAYLK